MTEYTPPAPTACVLPQPPAKVEDRTWNDLTPTGVPLVWLDEPAFEYVLIRPLFVVIPARAIDPASTGAVFIVPTGTRCSAAIDDWEIQVELLRVHLEGYQPKRAKAWVDWLRARHDVVHE